MIFDKKKASQTVENLTSVYHNEGYFNVDVNFDVKFLKNKKAIVNYIVVTDKPYKIDTITTNIESKVLDSIYKLSQNESFIKKGEQFKYSLFLAEQNRITKLFRNSGVYRFNKNAILIDADTSNYKSNIDLIINDSIANVPFKIQKIKNINIYTDYTYNTKDDPVKDSLNYKEYLFLTQDKLRYNPKLLLNDIFIEPNDIYKDEFCISPLKSLSLHLTNINSSYGLSPFIDYKKLWDANEVVDA